MSNTIDQYGQFMPLINQLDEMETELLELSVSERDIANQKIEEVKQKLVKLLIDAVDHKDDETRRGAVYGLSKLKDNSAVPVFIKSIKDRDEMVRSWACEGLGHIKDKSVISVLLEALFDESIYVYYSASTALKKFSNDELWVPIEKILISGLKYDKRRVIKLIGEINERRALPFLTEHLKDPNPSIRYECVEAIRRIGDRESTELLIECLNDESRDVRVCCIQTLSWLKAKKALPYLMRIYLYNEDLRSFVSTAISEIAGSNAIMILNDALDLVDDLIETKLDLIMSCCPIENI